MSSRVPRMGRLTAFAFALTLFWFQNAAAQTRAIEEKAEPLTLGSAVTTVLSAGESTLTEVARLLQSDPYWQFRGASYSNSGLMNEQDEIKLGNRLHAEFGKKFDIVSEGQARAERIGQRVARTSLRPNLTYRFHVIRDKELNAFSGPGGHIYITTALMNLASDDEVASVLSHEVSHIVARHSLKTIQQSQNLRGLADIFGSVTGIAGSTAQELGTAAATIVAGGLLAVHNREEEREADFLGVHAMAKAGYNPQAMLTMFEKIQSAGRKDESLLGAVFADHPGVSERIENTRYEINRMR
ncbi:MAG TPA: M48 family metallopeptidase [Pyrinomonadaceae bacterium]|nr:M48 family metallopeptidase [Pyrinomonadaceae bacterium]